MFGRKEPIVSENPKLRARAAPLFDELNSLQAESDAITARINSGTAVDAAANVEAFQTVQANLRRNNEALAQLRKDVGADPDIFDPTLGKQLEEARRRSTGTIDTFATAGTRAANALKNAQGNDPSTGSTNGDTTTTDGDNRVGTGASGFNGRDDRETEVGKTNSQDGSGSGDNKDARLKSINLAAGGVPRNMADVNRSVGVSIRTGYGEGATSPVGEDWRVRISLATNSTLFYKNNETGPGIQGPLINTDGVVFPYTPSITVSHTARYGETKLTHSNYGSFFYEGSEVSAISISGEFTVQTEEEGKYVLAALTFFRSCTKMFFGNQDDQRYVGSPPPMVFLNGYGKLYFPNVPCVITNFSHTMPAEVDYVEVKHSLDEISPYGKTKTGGITKSQIEMLNSSSTRIPTSSTLAITVQPVYSRKFVHESFNLESFASGELLLSRGGFI
jgi:hypothetical protein